MVETLHKMLRAGNEHRSSTQRSDFSVQKRQGHTGKKEERIVCGRKY